MGCGGKLAEPARWCIVSRKGVVQSVPWFGVAHPIYVKQHCIVEMPKINHSKPMLDAGDIVSLNDALSSGYLSHGSRAEEAGRQMSAILGMDSGLAVQSGTDALTLALLGLGLSEGGRVAVPAYMCSAVLDALALAGLVPVPVDIDRETLAISPDLIPDGVSAVIGAHLFGIPAPLHRVVGAPLVEDCAQTLGTEVGGRRVGSMGSVSICSFYATKLLTSGHGGGVATSDRAVYARMLELVTHDKIDEWSPRRHYLMSDLNAALLLSQLAKLDSMLERRRTIAAGYLAAMGAGKLASGSVYSRFLVVPGGVSADDILADFEAAGIEAKRPVYTPVFACLGCSVEEFPNANWAHENLVSVPLYPALTKAEIDRVEMFLEAHANELRCWPPA